MGGNCAPAASLALLLLLLLVASPRGSVAQGGGLTRGSFPEGFVFGTASAAYQYEGAVKADGRGQTIWDKFAHSFGKIADFSNADVAVDQYHRFEEDIQLMADMGMDAYRFSIAWARILPNGVGQVNQAGIDHYNKLIDALLAKGIQPYVTLYHWDLPQALEDKYIGWLDRQIVNDFAAYAETCFKAFGDRVKHWITVNEPHTMAVQGYDAGLQAPGRCSVLFHLYCSQGNSGTEPYVVAHNIILAHATVSNIYRNKYKVEKVPTARAELKLVVGGGETSALELCPCFNPWLVKQLRSIATLPSPATPQHHGHTSSTPPDPGSWESVETGMWSRRRDRRPGAQGIVGGGLGRRG